MNGIYIHVPFCVKKCLYCDFYSETDTSLTGTYVKALALEIKLTARSCSPETARADTIYFGGGTPSILSTKHLNTFLSVVHDHYHVIPGSEITLEANPGTLNAKKLKELKSLGINRLSLGVQSFDNANLAFLGRIHDADQAKSLIREAQTAGFDNLGLDLIYGLPNQSLESWKEDIAQALSFDPAHLSCYMLTLEPGTPLFHSMEMGTFSPLDEKGCERFFIETMELLCRNGFDHYEISNFARSPTLRSRHNQKYWLFHAYTGFGPSAHSYNPYENLRSWNIADLKTYSRMVNQGKPPVDGREILTPDQQVTEALFLGFRIREGICLSAFKQRFGRDFVSDYGSLLDSLTENGLIVREPDHVRLTQKGMVLADRITSLFNNHTPIPWNYEL